MPQLKGRILQHANTNTSPVMTTTTDTSTDEPTPVPSPRTRRTYAADWALFTDWCAATDTTALPTDPQTVVDFLTGCPAAPGGATTGG